MYTKIIHLILAAAVIFFFTGQLGAQDTISVTAPDGGETWTPGSVQTITWTSTGTITDVKIWYSRDDGANWILIESSTVNDGSYQWTVPDTPSLKCRVRVGDLDHDPDEMSAGAFYITAPLVSPFSKVTTTPVSVNVLPSYGGAWSDYDNDGDDDLIVPQYGLGNALYKNNGDGSFMRIYGGRITGDGEYSIGSSWGDYDNDGDPDLFVTNYSYNNSIYRNDGAVGFTKISSGIIVNDLGNSFSAAWGDYNNDGFPDIFVCNNPHENYLYKNNKDGSFEKIAGGDIVTDTGASIGAAWADYDNDGDLDLFVANTANSANFLYNNNGDGTFSKAPGGDVVTGIASSIGGSWGDYDNDQDLDLFVANSTGVNFLYENKGGGVLEKVETGPVVTDAVNSSGSCWLDYDNDGDLDLFVGNRSNIANSLYRNDGSAGFVKITGGVLVTDGGDSRAVSRADYDNDGDADVLVVNYSQTNALYENTSTGNHWLRVKVVGRDRSSIGARVRVRAIIFGSFVTQIREIGGSSGAYSQGGMDALFGLGDAAVIGEVHVQWPSGESRTYTNVAADQVITTTMHPVGAIRVISPNGGEIWPEHTTQLVTWSAPPEVTAVNIDYSTDNGLTYKPISAGTGNDGVYLWKIPVSASYTCKVRVSETGTGGLTDTGDFLFQIEPGPSDVFTLVTTGNIGTDKSYTYGCYWGDYNKDGFDDLYVTNYGAPNFFYENNGDGTFTKITSGAAATDSETSIGASWGDFDNDGDLDLFVANYYYNNTLYRNNGGVSLSRISGGDVTSTGGNSYSAAWGDYNNDGYLDLFVCNNAQTNFFYENKATVPGMVSLDPFDTTAPALGTGSSIGAAWGDYNNDGFLDLFVSNAANSVNFLYKNTLDENGDNEFSLIGYGDITTESASSIGASWGDYDNDGDLDLFVANSSGSDSLYRNDGLEGFKKVLNGPVPGEFTESNGSCWLDYDNDGDLDLVTASRNYDSTRLFRNEGGGRFSQIKTGAMVTELGDSRAVSWSDYDKDGDVDLFFANYNHTQTNRLYRNEGNSNHWLRVHVKQNLSTAALIGVRVKVKAVIYGETVWQLRELSGAGGGYAQSSNFACFGLGDAVTAEEVRVEWPTGETVTYTDVAADQVITTDTQPETGTDIKVVSPNGGEAWEVGTVHPITWTSRGTIPNVKIEFSGDRGVTWEEITASTPNDGSYNWTVPSNVSTASNDCLVRVGDVDGFPSDTSDALFAVTAPAVILIAPNGGETWETGTAQTITWTHTGTVANIKIEYSINGGTTWDVIEASIANSGRYDWTVPNNPSTTCLVRISDAGGTVSDVSDTEFIIAATPKTVTVTVPNGGENWGTGTVKTITWTFTGAVSAVKIEYSTDDGTTWNVIESSVPNTGSYNWTVPDSPALLCLVKVSDASGTASDIGDAEFTIFETPKSVTLTAPNGTETWVLGSNQTITWTHVGTITDVKIEYSTDNGSTWNEIEPSVPNNGSYDWTVSAAPSTTCKVKISDAADGTVSDESDNVFTFEAVPMTITIFSPESAGLLNTPTITINGKIAGPLPSKVSIDAENAVIIGDSFYFTAVQLDEGPNTLNLETEDGYGNTAQKTLDVNLDTTLPVISITTQPVTPTAQRFPVIEGTVTETNLNHLRVNGVDCTVTDTNFNTTVTLEEGENTIAITAEDLAGNTAETVLTITGDMTGPLINVTAPANKTTTNEATVTVTGTAEDDNIPTVTINDIPAAMNGTQFALAGITLQEGENILTIAAADTLDNQSTVLLTLYLDTEAPQVTSTAPDAAATGIPENTEIQVEFSETIHKDSLINDHFYLEYMDNGTPQRIDGTLRPEGTTVTLTPASPLPPDTDITIRIDAGIIDPAGNALANAGDFTFKTKDTTPPALLTAAETPVKTALKEITLTGTSESNAVITVTGGTAPVTANCDGGGVFSVAVPLNENKLNQIHIIAADAAGNAGEPLMRSIYHETVVFEVEETQIDGQDVILTFSKPVDAATLNDALTNGALTVTTASGTLTGTITVSADGLQATLPTGTTLTNETVKIDVASSVTDSEGLTPPYPYTEVLNTPAGQVMALGEVYDDDSGLPLEGVVVTLISVDGVSPAAPAPAVLTTAEGTYVLPIPAGACVLRFTREGYTASNRIISGTTGSGGVVFDARIRKRDGQEKNLHPDGGTLLYQLKTYSQSYETTIICQTGAVSTQTGIRTTAVGGQSLQGRLPFGWSPLAALEIRSDGAASPLLANDATLRVSNLWPGLDAADLVLAYWDETQTSWIYQSDVTVSTADLAGTLTAAGQYAFLVKDENPAAPGAGTPGAALPGLGGGDPVIPADNDIDTLLSFVPSEILPGDVSAAVLTVSADGGGAGVVSSGTAVRASLSESYLFLGNFPVNFKSRTMDLTAYNYGGDAAKVEFAVANGSSVTMAQLDSGSIHAEMSRYLAGTPGTILDNTGGTVENGNVKVIIDADALTQPAAVSIKEIAEADLTMPLPTGFTVVGALEFSTGGALLTAPATLSMVPVTTVTAGDPLLVVRLGKTDPGYGWVLNCRAKLDTGRVESDMNAVPALPFTGVTEGGVYLFLRGPADMGFVTGTVTYEGQSLTGALITTASHDITSFSLPGYVQVASEGIVNLDARHLTGGDTAAAQGTLPSAGDTVTIDIAMTANGPLVVSTTPVDLSTDVLANTTIVLGFSEPVAAASFNAQSMTVTEGTGTAAGEFRLSGDGRTGEFTPDTSFTPGAAVTVTVNTSLTDTEGNGMPGAYTSSFTVKADETLKADMSKITFSIPDETGTAHIKGDAGAVGPDDATVHVVNESTGETVSVTVDSPSGGNEGGSFDVAIAAEFSHIVRVHITDVDLNKIQLPTKPFTSEDGSRVVVREEGINYIDEDTGLGLVIEAGTFNEPAIASIYEETEPSVLADMPSGYQRLKAVRVDFGGRRPAKVFGLSITEPVGLDSDAKLFMAGEVSLFNEKKLTAAADAEVSGGRVSSASSVLPGCRDAGTFSLLENQVYDWAYVTGRVSEPGPAVLEQDFIYIAGNNSAAFKIPVPVGRAVTLAVRDMDTGDTLKTAACTAPPEKGASHDVGLLSDDREPPVLTALSGTSGFPAIVTAAEFTSRDITVAPVKDGEGTVNQVKVSGAAGAVIKAEGAAEPGTPGTVLIYKYNRESGMYNLMDQVTAEADGSFNEQTIPAKFGDRLMIMLEQGNVAVNREFVLEFSEPVQVPAKPAGETPIKLLKAEDESSGKEVEIFTELSADGKKITVTPVAPLNENTRYVLKIENLKDHSGNGLTVNNYFRTFVSTDIGSVPIAGDKVYDSVSNGNYLFVAAGDSGVKVMDVSNPGLVKNIAGYHHGTSGRARGVALWSPAGNKRLVVVGGETMQHGFISIADISNPSSPTEIKTVKISDGPGTIVGELLNGTPVKVKVVDNYAFIAISDAGLLAINLADFTSEPVYSEAFNAAWLDLFKEDRALDVALYQNKDNNLTAVLLVERWGIKTFDCSTLGTTAPELRLLGSLYTGFDHKLTGLNAAKDYPVDTNGDGKFGEFEVRDMVFFAEESGNICVVDISAPRTPAKYMNIPVYGSGGIADAVLDADNKKMLVSDLDLGIAVMDMAFSPVRDIPAAARRVTTINIGGSAHEGLLLDNEISIAYVSDNHKEIDVVKLGNPVIRLVHEEVDESTGEYEDIEKIAPSGVKQADNPEEYPAVVRVMARLPVGDGSAVTADLWSLNAAGEHLSATKGAVETYIKDLTLTQKSTVMGDKDYNVYLSAPIRVTLLPNESVGTEKILAGDRLRVNLSPLVADRYQDTQTGKYPYITKEDCEAISAEVAAVRADIVDREENFQENQTEKPASPANNPSMYSGVLLHSGEFVYDDVDMVIPGRGFDFVFKRTYRSRVLYPGVMGWGWDHNYNRRLLELPGGDVIYFDGTGRRERFTFADNRYTAPAGWFTQLKKMVDGSFRHIFADRTIEYFDGYGRLTKIRDRNGNRLEFYYSLGGQLAGVLDTMGRMIEFEYFPFDSTDITGKSARLKKITDFSGRTVTYTYDDTTGDLKEVDFMGRIKKYTYSQDADISLAHNLEQYIDPRGYPTETPILTVT